MLIRMVVEIAIMGSVLSFAFGSLSLSLRGVDTYERKASGETDVSMALSRMKYLLASGGNFDGLSLSIVPPITLNGNEPSAIYSYLAGIIVLPNTELDGTSSDGTDTLYTALLKPTPQHLQLAEDFYRGQTSLRVETLPNQSSPSLEVGDSLVLGENGRSELVDIVAIEDRRITIGYGVTFTPPDGTRDRLMRDYKAGSPIFVASLLAMGWRGSTKSLVVGRHRPGLPPSAIENLLGLVTSVQMEYRTRSQSLEVGCDSIPDTGDVFTRLLPADPIHPQSVQTTGWEVLNSDATRDCYQRIQSVRVRVITETKTHLFVLSVGGG